MCGIAGVFGSSSFDVPLSAMVARQRHRGPDDTCVYVEPKGAAGLGHNRLSIIDRSSAGRQPMSSVDGVRWIAFNGEIYNYRELRAELAGYPYRTQTDTEVILAAYDRWGEACLDRFLGMFALLLWDERDRRLFAARDRFGVKPLYYAELPGGGLAVASEIKALHAAGVPADPDPVTWSTYLTYGLHDHSERTFWNGVRAVPPGHVLTWQDGTTRLTRWYDLAERVGVDFDARSLPTVREDYRALLIDSVRLRFRSDVPVGINLSGGLDSSVLLGLVQAVQGAASDLKAFTFVTGDARYDELAWARKMLERTAHPSVVCRLAVADVPDLADSVSRSQDEPFGGLPTLAYARLFEQARSEGVVVLLDGQGMDEQWAGYDYYQAALDGRPAAIVQGTSDQPVRPTCLSPEFRALAHPFEAPTPFPDRLRNLQYRDVRYTKMPRALRFNDRISMRVSTELREPFLDHRLMELAFRQPPEHTIAGIARKRLLREIGRQLLPDVVSEAPKRAMQTPQREWLRGPLRDWASGLIHSALAGQAGDWLDARSVLADWRAFGQGLGDNSFFVWQWISLGLLARNAREVAATTQ